MDEICKLIRFHIQTKTQISRNMFSLGLMQTFYYEISRIFDFHIQQVCCYWIFGIFHLSLNFPRQIIFWLKLHVIYEMISWFVWQEPGVCWLMLPRRWRPLKREFNYHNYSSWFSLSSYTVYNLINVHRLGNLATQQLPHTLNCIKWRDES